MLSGMNALAQVEDNTAYMQDMKPLTDKERALLRSVKAAYAKTWKFACDDFAALDRNDAGVPISGIIRACNSLLIQPNPYFGAELNYYKNFPMTAPLKRRTTARRRAPSAVPST